MALNLKAQATINLNTPGLRQFMKDFGQMQKGMQQLPRQWANVQKASTKSLANMSTVTRSITTNMAAATTQIRQFNAAMTAAANSANRLSAATGGMGFSGGGGGGGGGRGSRDSWRNLWGAGRNLRTRLMLRGGFGHGSAGSLLIRGGLPLGSVLGMGFLAGSASDSRREYMGLGTSYGPMRAFSTNFNRLVDSKSLLSSIATAQGDTSDPSYTAVRSMGIDPRGKDPTTVAMETMDAIRREVRGQDDGAIGRTFHARNLSALGYDQATVRRVASESDENYEKFKKDFIRDQDGLSVSDRIMKKWQDLAAEFTRSWEKIQSALFTGLEGLAPGFGELSSKLADLLSSVLKSDEFKKLFEAFGRGLEFIANSILTGDFRRGLKEFSDNMIYLGGKMKEWAEDLGLIPKKEEYGPPASLAGNYLQSPILQGLAYLGSLPVAAWKGLQGGANTLNTIPPLGPQIMGAQQSAGNWLGNWIGKMQDYFTNKSANTSGLNPNAYITPGKYALTTMTDADKAFLDTIINNESGSGGYGTMGPLVRYKNGRLDQAYGRYGVMGENIPSWTEKLLGKRMTKEEYRADPLAQDRLALARFNQYVAQHGLKNALSLWHSGDLYDAAIARGATDGRMTTEAYVAKGLEYYRKHPGAMAIHLSNATGGNTTVSTSTTATPPSPPSDPNLMRLPGNL